MMRDLAALGGVVVLTLLTVAVIGFFLLQRRPRPTWSPAAPT